MCLCFCAYCNSVVHMLYDDSKCVCSCSLTVKSDVVVGQDCGSVALSNSPHGNVQHTVGCFHIVLLNNTTNNK